MGSKRRKKNVQVEFQVATRCTGVPPQDIVLSWARAAAEQDCRVTIRIVGRPEALALNQQFRGRSYATNVLTFVYTDQPLTDGDIALCATVVKREAREQGKEPEAHWAHLVVHGMLHLQGYDHENPEEAEIMESRETQILRELGYPDPYRIAA